jgi:3-oxoadipate enol-lactonase
MTEFALIVCRVVLLGWLCGSCSPWAQSMKAGGPGSFLSIEGSKIYFEECGTSSQAVVLLHDGVLHSAVWDEVWPEFCKHFHTIRYDRRGYGRSSAATSGYYETDDLAALLRHLKASRAAVVGSSHGSEIID